MRTRRECTQKHTILVETSYIHTTISSRSGVILASRRDMCYDYTVTLHLDELCTTIMISTTHTATITRRIVKNTRRILMRSTHATGKTTKRLHTGIMHDIIHTYRTRTHVSTEAPCTCHTGHHVL